jgi:hypothetical protein
MIAYYIKKVTILTVLLLFTNSLLSQSDTTRANEIYSNTFRTAFADREINEDEQNLLKTLQKSLNIPDEQVQAIRSLVIESFPAAKDQSGRWPLVLQNMALGSGLYGWGIPYVLNVEDTKWFIGGEMFSLGSSFYLTYRFTKNMDISHGRAQLLRYGSIIGLHVAGSYAQLLQPDEEKFMVLTMMLGVPAGMIIIDQFYKRWQPDLGQAWAMTQWGELGYSTLSNIYGIISPYPKEPEEPIWDFENAEAWEQAHNEWEIEYEQWEEKEHRWKRHQNCIDAFGHPLGIWAERLLFSDRNYTFGDGLMLTWGRIYGFFCSVTLWDLFYTNSSAEFNETPGLIFNTAGSIGGIILADRYIRGDNYTAGQSILMAAGALSGGLFAAGIGIILEIDESRFYDLTSIAGSLAGIYLTRKILEVRSEVSGLPANDKFKIVIQPQIRQVQRQIIPGVGIDVLF